MAFGIAKINKKTNSAYPVVMLGRGRLLKLKKMDTYLAHKKWQYLLLGKADLSELVGIILC